jgi:hypothetical protein
MFGRNASTETAPREVVDESGTPVAETVVPDEEEHTQRIMTRKSSSTFDDEPDAVVPETVVPETVVPETVVEPVVESRGWAHVSVVASLSLIVGTLAIAATLTGLLAPLGFAAGILALILGVVAFASVSRRNVTGHGLVLFGVIFGAIAVVLSVLAMGNDLSWLSKDTNEVTVVHNWLNDHMHWLRRY